MAEAKQHEDLGVLLAMAYLAWSDRELSEDELALIRAEASDQGLDEAEVESLINVMLTGKDSLEEVKHALPTGDARRAAAFAAYVAALADHKLEMSELESFQRLCAALELSEAEVAEIRAVAEKQVQLAKSGDWEDSLLLERVLVLDAEAS